MRFLDRILSSQGDPTGTAGIDAALALAFQEMGPELGVRALAWFNQEPAGFLLQQAVGPDAGFAERVEVETGLRLAPRPRQARVWLDPADVQGPVALGLVAGGPTAILRFDTAPHQSLVLVALANGADAHAVEFVLGTIASAMSARASQERWQRSLEDAAEIQRSLLPTSVPVFPTLAIAARSVPAEAVGGDVLDFFRFGEGVLGVAVGDASGHGLPAALVARDVVVGLRVGLDRGMRIAGVLARLNHVLHVGLPARAFASLLYVELRADGRLEYVSAGHPPPLRVRRNGYTALRRSGPVLGPLEHAAYRRTPAQLENGETLVLYTDGITERQAPDGTLYGEERLAAEVSSRADEPVEAVVEGVLASVRAFGADSAWADDLTLVVIRRA